MAKYTKKSESGNVTVTNTHRKANIAVIVVVSIAVLILVAVAVLSAVRIDPTDKLGTPERYDFYDLDSTRATSTNKETQSKLDIAMGDMRFSIMSAMLQWKWDYSYNFKRNADGEKVKLSAVDLKNVTATSTEYMVEFVYPRVDVIDDKLDYDSAQSITVDGEKVYFDRVKVLIGNSNGEVGTISLYPYLSARIDNASDIDGIASDTYEITGINVRANTTSAFAALKDLATELKK